MVQVAYKAGKSPLPHGDETKTGCIFCCAEFIPLVYTFSSFSVTIISQDYFSRRLRRTRPCKIVFLVGTRDVDVVLRDAAVVVEDVAVGAGTKHLKTKCHNWPPTLCNRFNEFMYISLYFVENKIEYKVALGDEKPEEKPITR
jgi:hypothetical protein